MEFISNLIKRPISLVINETSNPMDKIPTAETSPSLPLPNNINNLMDNSKVPKISASEEREINHNNKNFVTNMSSSCHAGNITDFIGVPDGYLGEFEDILPPPPPLQSNSLLDIEITRSLSISPPPPTPLSEEQIPLTTSMKASQTIDELLSHINDNLEQAGLNADILTITSSSNIKSELNNLSGKAVLNNSKLLTPSATNSDIKTTSNTSKISTAAAGSAATVFENNSSLNKFPIDPDLETGLYDGVAQEQNQLKNQHQHVINKDLLNNAGLNKPSNKFVGLTAFDETKIPELPGDLNPNIEEQYNITFEECFIPTLTTQQEIKLPEEFVIDRTHLLLPTETNTVSSDNEAFEDCHGERDPLGETFAETGELDGTTDLESYRSAVNTINGSHNETMENIADITLEAESQSLKPQVVQDCQTGHNQQSIVTQEDEPMDVDMNATMEMMQQTSNNIQHVEKVLQHAENILQHIEEKIPVEDSKDENASVAENACENTQNGETEQLKHEFLLNETIELSSKSNNVCSAVSIEDFKEENNEVQTSKTAVKNSINLSINSINSSIISNSSAKSASDVQDETKLNLTLNLDNSMTSQKNTAPSSPSFPIKNTQNEGFPRSPKSLVNKQPQSPFLEKSNFTNNNCNSFNGTFVEPCSDSDQPNDTFLEPTVNEKPLEPNNIDNNKRLSFGVDSFNQELGANAAEVKSPTQEMIMQFPAAIDKSNDKRRTFCVNEATSDLDNCSTQITQTCSTGTEKPQTHNVQSQISPESNTQFPAAVDKSIEKRRTFCTNKTAADLETLSTQTLDAESLVLQSSVIQEKTVSGRTFNVAPNEIVTEQNVINTGYEPMDVEDIISEDTTEDEQPQSLAESVAQQGRSQSPTLHTVQQRSQSPVVPAIQPRSESPLLSTRQRQTDTPPLPSLEETSQSTYVQERSHSPPLPTMQQKSHSPPLPAMQHQNAKIKPVALSTLQEKTINIKKEQLSPTLENDATSSSFNPQLQPLPTLIQKRPPIRNMHVHPDILSAKEQNNIKVKDEKDIFVEICTPSPVEDVVAFTGVSSTSTTLTANTSGFSEFNQTSSSSSSSLMANNGEKQDQQQQNFEEQFSGNSNIILNPSDFEYLLTKGNNNTHVDRSSLLLKFDPLLGVPVPVNQEKQEQQQLQLQIPTNTINPCLSPTLEEDEHNHSNRSFVIENQAKNGDEAATVVGDGVDDCLIGVSAKLLKERSQAVKPQLQLGPQVAQQNRRQLIQGVNKKNATMSVDVIKDMSLDNDCNKTFENSNSTQSDDKQTNYKMDELEKKIKNEVLKTEDIEKKLKDAEQREEALIKRITEKDKTVAKMTGVIEAYEKAIAELIAEKEQLIQNYEKQLAEVKADRDSNYHHLTSLETTFSDLHVKYEKSKEMTCQLKASEEALQAEKRKNLENLHLQEQRYEKMKNHAIQQLEIANKKLESLTRDHSIETTKLKALLKKEEIARSSINEQLAQKTKENAELVKICDELIANQGS